MVFLVTGGTGFIGKRVVRQLLNKNFEVIASDINIDNEKDSFYNYLDLKKQNHNKLNLIEFNIKSKSELKNILETKKITHIIACGYQMSNLIDNNPVKGAEINIVGMTNLFQSVVDYNLKKMVFPSSQSVYGDSQKLYGDKQVRETDYCGLQHQLFTYAVMKLLNEFMAEKYVKKHKAKISCTRPSVVFGFGRKRSSLMWAEEFATNPALGKPVHLPFPKENKDNYIYVEDCAEQLIQLALKDNLNHFVYNTGSETASGIQIKNIIKELVPNAIISFDEKGSFNFN